MSSDKTNTMNKLLLAFLFSLLALVTSGNAFAQAASDAASGDRRPRQRTTSCSGAGRSRPNGPAEISSREGKSARASFTLRAKRARAPASPMSGARRAKSFS